MAQGNAQADPLEMWREWVANSERQWNGFLNKAMATDEFSQSLGRFMDVYLNMQKNMNDTMGRYFSALNVPSRTDVVALGERLTLIEERLGSIETMLASARTAPVPAISAEAAPPPPRTKKPAAHQKP
jgi:polyhydroxyalkanoic acid synthase PhaR subunit